MGREFGEVGRPVEAQWYFGCFLRSTTAPDIAVIQGAIHARCDDAQLRQAPRDPKKRNQKSACFGVQVSNVQSNLMPGERLVCSARVHWIVFVPGAVIMLGAILSALTHGVVHNPACVIAFWLGLYVLVHAHAMRGATELAVTTHRIFARHGLVKRESVEIHHNDVESFVVTQGIVRRQFGYGTLTINGAGGVRIRVRRVEKPIEFRRCAGGAVDATKSAGTLKSKAA